MDGNWEEQDATWDSWGEQPDLKPQPKPDDKKKKEEADETVRPVRPEEGDV